MKFKFTLILLFLIQIIFAFSQISYAQNKPASTFSEKLKVSKRWRIAFVSKDKVLANEGQMSMYWIRAWTGAQKVAVSAGAAIEEYVVRTPCMPEVMCVEPQIKIVLDIINKGETDGIVIGPMNSARLVPVVEKAINAGIPVIAMDTALNSDKILSFVVFDNFAAGKLVGQWVTEQLGGKGQVAILKGPEDQRNAIDRHNGFLAGLSSGNIQIVRSATADWDHELAKKLVMEWLPDTPDLKAIIAANDLMAMGAIEALEQAGRQGVIVTGYDGNDFALQAVATGRMAATIDQMPDVQAERATQMLLRHLETGDTYNPIVTLAPDEVITKKNVADYLPKK